MTEYLRMDWILVDLMTFSQNLPYSPTSKFQELETGFHEIFIQSDIKSVRQILCKLRKCEIKLN